MTRLALGVLLAMAGCEVDEPSADEVTADQAAGLEIQVRAIGLLAQQYERSMTTATEDSCIGIQRTYDRSARMAVARMLQFAAQLDAAIADRGGPADVGCAIDALAAELDLHAAVACGDTLDLDRIEASRHLLVVAGLRNQLGGRAGEVEATVASGTPAWSLPSACP